MVQQDTTGCTGIIQITCIIITVPVCIIAIERLYMNEDIETRQQGVDSLHCYMVEMKQMLVCLDNDENIKTKQHLPSYQ